MGSVLFGVLLLTAPFAAAAWADSPVSARSCASGVHVASVTLRMVPPDGGEMLPARYINVAPEGYLLNYTPAQLPFENPGRARVALVAMAADESRKVYVLDAMPADKPAVWTLPVRASVLGLVFGQQGLDTKKLKSLVVEDADLVAQLAEYADKTSQAENLAQALAAHGRQPLSAQNLEGALRGFSNAWGLPMSRIDQNMPVEQQTAILLRTLNPAVANYDPLAPQSSQRMAQTAGMAAAVAGLFLGPTVGLAAGSTSLFLNLRTAMFPNTDFRSLFAQANREMMVLCGQREQHRPRTRLAYLWATKLPDLEEPKLSLGGTLYLPSNQKSTATLHTDWPVSAAVLSRARIWHLRHVASNDLYLVKVTPTASAARTIEIEIDPIRSEFPPGEYRLQAMWDWDELDVAGPVFFQPVGDLDGAALTAASRDRLVEGAGLVEIELEGADFAFVRRLTIDNRDDRSRTPVELEIAGAPRGADGTVRTLGAELDTRKLAAGLYTLKLHQTGDRISGFPVRVLPPHPVLSGLPLRANQGEAEQILTLRGERLDRIVAVESGLAGAEILSGTPAERTLKLRLPESAAKGQRLALSLRVEGLEAPLPVPGAIEVTGPRPRIVSVSASPQPQLGVEVSDSEMVAGVTRSYSLQVDGLDDTSRVYAECESGQTQLAPVAVRPGEAGRGVTVQRAGPGSLFLTIEPGAFATPGCSLALRVRNDVEGDSQPYKLGAVIRLPRIERFEFADERAGEFLYYATLHGADLDTIAKAGWSAEEGHSVAGLPTPDAAQPGRQTLRIVLPWPAPSPRAPLYIFLRGEGTGRRTNARL
jgi:hypothetical protein